jgi:uncharacterized protein (TIGR03089 family)
VDFRAVLESQLRRDAGRPLVTFYDDATGERVELSVTTYANWVAKTAALAQDELDLTRGDLVLVDLPTHWLGPVWLGAAWSLGLAVTTEPALLASCRLVVCGPDGLDGYAASGPQVVALSLRPLGARFASPLPAGVLDYGAVVLGLPDVFLPDDPPTGDDVAWRETTGTSTQAELLDGAAAEGGRLLTDVNPCTRAGVATLLGPLQGGGGTVWVRNPDPATWEHRAETERATPQLPRTKVLAREVVPAEAVPDHPRLPEP